MAWHQFSLQQPSIGESRGGPDVRPSFGTKIFHFHADFRQNLYTTKQYVRRTPQHVKILESPTVLV